MTWTDYYNSTSTLCINNTFPSRYWMDITGPEKKIFKKSKKKNIKKNLVKTDTENVKNLPIKTENK